MAKHRQGEDCGTENTVLWTYADQQRIGEAGRESEVHQGMAYSKEYKGTAIVSRVGELHEAIHSQPSQYQSTATGFAEEEI